MTNPQDPASSSRSVRSGSLSLRASSLWLLIASVLLVILLVVTQSTNVANQVRLAQGGHPLAAALLLRERNGDLPGGPGAPGIYALARAAGKDAGAGNVWRVEIDHRLREAADALAGLPGGQRLRGIALGSLGEYPRAEQQLQAAAQDDLFAALALGNVLDEQGQLDAARALWQPLQAERALSTQLHRAASALSSQGRRAQAEALLLRAIAIDPTNANAYHTLGGFYWGPDRTRSRKMYQAALDTGGLEPFFERFAAGRVAFIEGRLEEAAVALEEALRLQPNHSDAAVLLATTLSRLGRPSEAIRHLEYAIQQSPHPFWPLVELGRLYVDLADYDRAIEVLTTAVGLRADMAQPFELLAEAYEGAGQAQQAVSGWQQATTVDPGNAAYHARLGDALAAVGRTSEAIAAYRQALAINPSHGPARRGLSGLGVEP